MFAGKLEWTDPTNTNQVRIISLEECRPRRLRVRDTKVRPTRWKELLVWDPPTFYGAMKQRKTARMQLVIGGDLGPALTPLVGTHLNLAAESLTNGAKGFSKPAIVERRRSESFAARLLSWRKQQQLGLPRSLMVSHTRRECRNGALRQLWRSLETTASRS